MDAGAGGMCHDGFELKDLHCRMLALRAVPVLWDHGGRGGKWRGGGQDGGGYRAGEWVGDEKGDKQETSKVVAEKGQAGDRACASPCKAIRPRQI